MITGIAVVHRYLHGHHASSCGEWFDVTVCIELHVCRDMNCQ